MRPQWVIDVIQSALVVRVDFVHPVGGGQELAVIEIFGGFWDEDGWDVSHLRMSAVEGEPIGQLSFDSLFLPKVEVGYDFVRDHSRGWHEGWLQERRHIAGAGEVANGEQLICWHPIPTHDPRVLRMLTQVLVFLQQRHQQAGRARNELFALPGTINRLESLIREKQRHRDSFTSTE